MASDEVTRAFEILADAVDEQARRGEGAQMLMERGVGFDHKYIIMRLDDVRTTAGAIGYDTTAMRDPEDV